MISPTMVVCICSETDLWAVQLRAVQLPIKLQTAADHKWPELLPHLPLGSELHSVELYFGVPEQLARFCPAVTIAYRVDKLTYSVVICGDFIETAQKHTFRPGTLDPPVGLQRSATEGEMCVTRLSQRLFCFKLISSRSKRSIS